MYSGQVVILLTKLSVYAKNVLPFEKCPVAELKLKMTKKLLNFLIFNVSSATGGHFTNVHTLTESIDTWSKINI